MVNLHNYNRRMIIVGKHIENISLNDLEYLLDDEGNIKYFNSKQEAVEFLTDAGADEDDIEWFKFIDTETQKEVGEE